MRGDLTRLDRAAAILEVVDQVAQEGEADPELYRMLIGALRTVEHRDSPVVVPAFFFKVLASQGWASRPTSVSSVARTAIWWPSTSTEVRRGARRTSRVSH